MLRLESSLLLEFVIFKNILGLLVNICYLFLYQADELTTADLKGSKVRNIRQNHDMIFSLLPIPYFPSNFLPGLRKRLNCSLQFRDISI